MNTMTTKQEHELVELLRVYQRRIPDRVNLVDLLGANENAHTRILAAILGYKRDGLMPFVSSFVSRFIRTNDNTEALQVQHPSVATQQRYIDALLWEQSKYAIVIENKINWVVDQQQQIESYIKSTQDLCGINPHTQCYVIYLTDDGRKKVAGNSLTNEAKKWLEYEDENSTGRYIELNYREDILPWLKEDVLATCRYIEQTLMSMLQQYIDYLEHRFALDGHNEEVRFLEAHLQGTDEEKYAQLTLWNDWCRPPINIEDVAQETVESFSSQIQNTMDQMLKRNFSLNRQVAVSVKGNCIRSWAKENGFHPYKWYDSIFFQFCIGPHRERIKFQINLDDQSEKVWVQFFNNDYEDGGQRRTLGDYPKLLSLFRQNFPACDESFKFRESAVLGEFTSESQLLAVLNGPVKEFLEAFYAEFQPQEGVNT